MKNLFFNFNLIIIFFMLFSSNIKAMILQCENGFSYKIATKQNSKPKIFFKDLHEDWQVIDKFMVVENKYELFLPSSTYLSCADKNLEVCKFSTLITYNSATGEANVREVILNDCYIGTMGCNLYNKGLELNQRRCKVIK